jgi:molecular chaperone GrpE
MVESDPERQNEAEQTGANTPRETAFTAEPAPQSSIAAPDLVAELETPSAENAGLKDKVLRTLAEMENLRRRSEKENADAKSYAITAFAREMLPFADNLARAISSVSSQDRETASPGLKSFIEGIELSERDFQSCLNRRGVKKLEPLGQKFDPNFHEALFEAPDSSVPPGTVVQVVEDGYQIGDRVLRPAKVGVARGGARAESAN